MGNAVSDGSRDVTFLPEDVVVTPAVVDRLEEMASMEHMSPEAQLYETEKRLQSRREQELEAEYERRLKFVEQRNEKLFQEAAAEYTKTVERLENKYVRPVPGGCCSAAEQRVEDCLRANPGRPLICSTAVTDYLQCVRNFRLASMNKEGYPQ